MKEISYREAIDFVLPKHYCGRKPQVKHAFGLYQDSILVAVVTYGVPASRNLCIGILGTEYADKIIELNRVCRVDDCSIQLSQFISWSLKQLKKYNYLIYKTKML
jgi:hypothetical protein